MTEKIREQVVLLDESYLPVGTADKATVHAFNTPLHLAFSCHIFNFRGSVLVTRRALSKKTWPGVWTNSVCGHPGPGEAMEVAVRRRARYELGLELTNVTLALPDFRYKAKDASGIVENEFCPVFSAFSDDVRPRLRDSEVIEYRWVPPLDLFTAAEAAPWAFSPWLVLQVGLLRPFCSGEN